MDKRLWQMKAKEQLTSEYVAKRLDYNPETGIFTWKTPTAARLKSGDIAGTIHKTGYVKIILDGISYWAHRLVWLYYYYKELPKGEAYQIDHINGKQIHLGSFYFFEDAVKAREAAEIKYGYIVRKEG